MDRIIRHITKQLVDLLPDDQSYYRLEELRSWGLPVFIIQRIQVELERNLAESITRPQTEWANMQSDAVQVVWKQFVDAIRKEARLPASYAHSVIETAVADVLDMLVQPRKNLPEVIFGADEELVFDEVVERMNAVVVYRHFAQLIPRYMQKKGLEKLSKEQCTGVIAKADARMTDRYSPLNWAQMLDPLFSLLDQKIDSNLMRLFFEDKKMPRIARQFDKLDASVDRAQLIEVLSSPESLNMEDFEDQQSEIFSAEQGAERQEKVEKEKKKDRPEAEMAKEKAAKAGGNGSKREDATSRSRPRAPKSRFEDDPIVGAFHKFREGLSNKDSENVPDQEENSINSVFSGGEEEDTLHTEEENSLNDIFLEQSDDSEKLQQPPEANGLKAPEKKEILEEFTEADSERSESKLEIAGTPDSRVGASDEVEHSPDETVMKSSGEETPEEVPMWKRFLSPEEVAALEEQEAAEENMDEDGFIAEPLIDLTQDSGPSEADVQALIKLMEDDRRMFVRDLFRGSESAFDETLIEIADMDDWRSVSKYIDQEVFRRNLVDLYSEAAVEFTDRLHTYFLKKSKS